MNEAPVERSKVIEILPPTLHNTVAITNGPPFALIRARSLVFAAKLTTVPSGTSVCQWGIEMSMDGVVWIRSIVSGAFLDSQAVPTVFTAKLSLQSPQIQRIDSQTVPNDNEYDWAMKWVRSYVSVSLFAGSSGFTLSVHQIT